MNHDIFITAPTSIRARIGGRQRFYKTVEVRSRANAGQSGYTLHLGRYPIKTPGRNLLVLPTLPLALAIAAEWEWQVAQLCTDLFYMLSIFFFLSCI